MILPIQTVFNNHFFRSRLEARWAVFFTVLGIEYQYEPEGYEVTEGNKLIERYLPDFFLPKVYQRNTTSKGWQVEIKPDGNYNDKLDLISEQLKMPGILLAGSVVRHDNHLQHGEFRDDNMNFRKCEDCHSVLIGYGYKHATCPNCGGYCCDKEVIEAAKFANFYRFEHGEQIPWPRQPQADSTFPF